MPAVGIIMGSNSDWKTMQAAANSLRDFGISYEAKVVSAHRTPDYLFEYAEQAEERGLALIIAGAGGAAHLPGMTAAKTVVPVVGVPVVAAPLHGLDALLSIMQMPAEVGVATVGIGENGAKQAGVFAVAALGSRYPPLRAKLHTLRGTTGPSQASSPGRVLLLAPDEASLGLLQPAEDYLDKLQVAHASRVVGIGALSQELAKLEANGAAVFIAASPDGIDFACQIAKATPLPVLGVPLVTEVPSVERFLQPFLDMPAGVTTFAVNKPGAINAALFAATIISQPGSTLWKKLGELRVEQVKRVRAMTIHE